MVSAPLSVVVSESTVVSALFVSGGTVVSLTLEDDGEVVVSTPSVFWSVTSFETGSLIVSESVRESEIISESATDPVVDSTESDELSILEESVPPFEALLQETRMQTVKTDNKRRVNLFI